MRLETLTQSMASLLDQTAREIAEDALTNLDVREALQTTAISNGVQIGECQISFADHDGERLYELRFRDHIISDLAYYETARYIASRMNRGEPIWSPEIAKIISLNRDYRRTRISAITHAEQIKIFVEAGDRRRAHINEDRLDREHARATIFRQRLLQYSCDW